ncbi:MAG TPA: alpha/beta hydrolase [Caulobacteraceae bacterium]|nr:alpha/beta hydrolase [Caulobacteraceae bacterium]
MPFDAAFTAADFAARCAADGEFRIAARHWTGGLRLERPGSAIGVTLTDGRSSSDVPAKGAAGVITIAGPQDAWADLTAQVPARLVNDVWLLAGAGRLAIDGDRVLYAQYYPAIARAIELLRPALPQPAPPPARPAGAYDAPIGRYIHLELGGQDHRIYFEEAGRGIPMLLQHTAGCHSAQWRHLFERPEITDQFRLIAYDLPFHGKSAPPTGRKWWAEDYRLTGDLLRAAPLGLAAALQLERPVFMGCSVGGLLALDLALRHPDVFSAVISLEGALRIGGDIESLWALWHPQIGNEYKARLMNALMSPTSPEAFRKETSQVYASGWPPAFLGDLHYYVAEYDLTADAGRIDTSKVGVHILSGEYDASGLAELGEAAHKAIRGSTFAVMKGVGHFPMSENPDAFVSYLMPALDRIRAARV